MSLPAALKAELSAIIAVYKEEDNTQVVTCKDLIMDACRKHNQTYKIVCTVHQLGIHPLQRDGEGVYCGRAQTRVAMIRSIGFSWAAIIPNLICMEDNPHTKAIVKMTLKQCASNPKYARYREGTIVGGSLGAAQATPSTAQRSWWTRSLATYRRSVRTVRCRKQNALKTRASRHFAKTAWQLR